MCLWDFKIKSSDNLPVEGLKINFSILIFSIILLVRILYSLTSIPFAFCFYPRVIMIKN